MRSTVIPAQVTTVEDRIAGNLGVSQLLLLTVPVFAGSALFVILPPFFNYATYKVALIVCLAALCGVLAIRIKGRIVLDWIIAVTRYNTRPRYYVFDKNDTYLREKIKQNIAPEETEQQATVKSIVRSIPKISTSELVKIEELINNPQANLRFKTTRKGELRVHIKEVK